MKSKLVVFGLLVAGITAGVVLSTHPTKAASDPVMAASAAITKYNNDIKAGNVDAILSDLKDLRFQTADQVKANVQYMLQHVQGFQCQILGAKKIDETHVLVTIQFTTNTMHTPVVEDVPVVYENGKWTLVFEENVNYQHNHAKIRVVN